jgi:hypothetical protein
MLHLTMHAMALAMPQVAEHPNAWPFSGVLCRLNEASTRPPGGASGHVVRISTAVAQQAIPSLLGMGVDMTPDLREHDRRFKIGVVTEAHCAGNDLCMSGHFFQRDFAAEVEAIRRHKNELGFSYEIASTDVADPQAAVWDLTGFIFCGIAVLKKSAAAYEKTSITASRATVPDCWSPVLTELRRRGRELDGLAR